MRLHQTIVVWQASEAGIPIKQAASSGEKGAEALTTPAIPLKRVGRATPVLYASAIAHQLSISPDQTTTIAAQLVRTLRQALTDDQEPALQGISVSATATGFIQFEVSDCAIAHWLDSLLTHKSPQPPLPSAPMSETERQLLPQTPALFEVQHAHARCCSLLCLAHRESLIQLEKLDASPQDWQFSRPAALPWLTSTDQLCFQHPVDRALLMQLLDAYDHLFDPPQRRTQTSVLRSAHLVAQAFQAFHRAHPLWERAREDSTITVARLGLLMITQRVLHLLLRDGLKTDPVVEL